MANLRLDSPEDPMIAVEYDDLACAVTISGHPDALRKLARRLEQVAERAELQEEARDHLYSEEWSGFDLATMSPDAGSRGVIVHHVKLNGLAG